MYFNLVIVNFLEIVFFAYRLKAWLGESGPSSPKTLRERVSGPSTCLPAELSFQRGWIVEAGVSRLAPLGLLPDLVYKSQAASTVTHAVVGLLDQKGNNG